MAPGCARDQAPRRRATKAAPPSSRASPTRPSTEAVGTSWIVWLSTDTSKAQVPLLPAASAALQATVVVPTGKGSPDGGAQPGTATPGQLTETPAGG